MAANSKSNIKHKGGGDRNISGLLNKWTNYIKGYRTRWFVLDFDSATLSYYRNQSEVGNAPSRGSIDLPDARIHTENACNFIVSGSNAQTFHLKASNEVERLKWVSGIELARHRAIKAAESDEDEELKMEATEIGGSMGGGGAATNWNKTELHSALRMLESKMDDLRTCQELIGKHGSQLLKSLAEIESPTASDIGAKTKAVNERATLFRITTNAMIAACNEFVAMGQSHAKKWTRLLQYEHQQRLQLQDQLEQLARQHRSLERDAMKQQSTGGDGGAGSESSRRAPPYVDSDEEMFHDAAESVSELSIDRQGQSNKKLNRRGSHTSNSTVGDRTALFDAEFETCQRSGTDESSHDSQPSTPESARRECLTARKRRTSIPARPQVSLNLWSIMRNCIGKELSKIPMPVRYLFQSIRLCFQVNFNEPLSVLQRITEDLEYADILDRAASRDDSTEQMCYIAAYTVSSYSTTGNRTTKPFNPLLGETYECDRTDDLGWRSLTEQVSHHPPATAHYAEGRDWIMYQDFTMTSKFRGKYLSVLPVGHSHVEFANSGNHYSWRKVTTTVHNIIVGKLWIDNHGDMIIENHKTGDKCHLKFIPYSYFSRDVPRKVTAVVQDKNGVVKWVLQGTWDSHIDAHKVINGAKTDKSSVFKTLPARRIWTVNPQFPGAEKMYYFTKLAIELNEPEDGTAPTDSRLRIDQRLMEEGRWDESNVLKLKIEEKQRVVRRQRETEAEAAMLQGRAYKEYEPAWFRRTKDEYTGGVIHMYKGDYWECKAKQDWSRCPDLFETTTT